jgi:hypothetical protein
MAESTGTIDRFVTEVRQVFASVRYPRAQALTVGKTYERSASEA